MNTNRAAGVSRAQAGWVARFIYWALKRRIGRVPHSKTLAAHHTGTLQATTWMDAVCASARTVPGALKELVQLKVAMLVGCPF